MTERIIHQVPVRWLSIDGARRGNAANLAVCDVYRALESGGDYRSTTYFKAIRGAYGMTEDEAVGRIEALRALQGEEIDSEFAAPAILHGNGQYEMLDGHHRSGRFIVCGLPVPVEVKQVNQMWVDLEDRLVQFQNGHVLREQIDHPAFGDWDVVNSSGWFQHVHRFCNENNLRAGRAYDVGSSTGGKSRMLQEIGFSVIGIEKDPQKRAVAEHLNWVFDSLVSYRHGDVFEDNGIPRRAVVAVCVGVLDRVLGSGEIELARNRLNCMIQETKFLSVVLLGRICWKKY